MRLDDVKTSMISHDGNANTLRLFCFVVLGYFCVSQDALFGQLRPDSLDHRVVRIHTSNRDLGAGFFVDGRGKLVTAYHVIQGASWVQVFGTSGEFNNPRLVAYDDMWDLAVLDTDCSGDKGTEFFESAPVPIGLQRKAGVAIGHPDGKVYAHVPVSFPWGTVRPAAQFFGENRKSLCRDVPVNLLGIEMTFNPGMSGGPVVVDGKAVAVLSGGQSASGRNFGWAIPIERIRVLSTLPKPLKQFDRLPALSLLEEGYVPSILKLGANGQAVAELLLYEKMYCELADVTKKHTPLMTEFVDAVEEFRKPPEKGVFSFVALSKLLEKQQKLIPLKDVRQNAEDLLLSPLQERLVRKLKSLNEEQRSRVGEDTADRLLREIKVLENLDRRYEDACDQVVEETKIFQKKMSDVPQGVDHDVVEFGRTYALRSMLLASADATRRECGLLEQMVKLARAMLDVSRAISP